MKLIVETGGTKSSFALLENNQVVDIYSSEGYNYTNSGSISIPEEIKNNYNTIETAHFYMAGYTGKNRENPLLPYFIEQHYYSDLEGAVRALAGNEKAIVSILGTGSNVCIADKGQIFFKYPSLGYLIDDEGSGKQLGSLILKSYFSNTMPSEDRKILDSIPEFNYNEVLAELYGSKPAAYLAAYSKYMHLFTSEFRASLLNRAFESFHQNKILCIDGWKDYPFYFCGGIAKAFEKELRNFYSNKNVKIKRITNDVFEGLISYHQKHQI
ncbi:MAG TPA: hypothetical protein P5235_06810 [Saprospiraceae bacterium]|nr:hypothetical protein [Saprospiraceae bacterium]HRX29079.1 hypothetical protein [Saprospiraceae bacterium]